MARPVHTTWAMKQSKHGYKIKWIELSQCLSVNWNYIYSFCLYRSTNKRVLCQCRKSNRFGFVIRVKMQFYKYTKRLMEAFLSAFFQIGCCTYFMQLFKLFQIKKHRSNLSRILPTDKLRRQKQENKIANLLFFFFIRAQSTESHK